MIKQRFSSCELNIVYFDATADIITTSGVELNTNAFDSRGSEDLWDLYSNN